MSSLLSSPDSFVQSIYNNAKIPGEDGVMLYQDSEFDSAMTKFEEAFKILKKFNDPECKSNLDKCSKNLREEIESDIRNWFTIIKTIYSSQKKVSPPNKLPSATSIKNDPIEEFSKLLYKKTLFNERREETFEAMIGADDVKQTLFDSIIYPIRYPEAFPNIRQNKAFVISFGPPGTFKSCAFHALCNELRQDWKDLQVFEIGQETIKSKWHGDSSKLVKAFFDMVRDNKPAIVWIDEGDALLSDNNNANGPDDGVIAGFLKETDPNNTKNDQIILYLTTNKPDVITTGFNRRYTVRLYHGLPKRKVMRTLSNILLSSYNIHGLIL